MDNSPWHEKRLLLVDDEPELLAFVSGILTEVEIGRASCRERV